MANLNNSYHMMQNIQEHIFAMQDLPSLRIDTI